MSETNLDVTEKVKVWLGMKEKIKVLDDAQKTLQKEIMEEMEGDEPFIIGDKKVSRIDKKAFKLKDKKAIMTILKEFPEVTIYDIDMEALRNIPEAHKYIDVSVSSYLQSYKNKEDASN